LLQAIPRQPRFKAALTRFGEGPVLLLGHHDADGLASLALLARAFAMLDRPVRIRIVGRGENAWSPAMAEELRGMEIGGIIAADLGVRSGAIRTGTPAVLIDHHVPAGAAPDAVVISGYGRSPVPTSSLLAYWCAAELAPVDELLWIAALGIVGDMADGAGFPEMALARKRYGMKVLRDATALINAARRASSADARPALALLMKADSPRDIMSGRFPETQALLAAREEVRRDLDKAGRTAPIVRNGVALLRIHSPCQIHPLLAQRWRTRLSNAVVLAANTGYRPGWVHFAARSARDIDLVDFLSRHAPVGADENYGGGHERASGGALRIPQWNAFVAGLGFGPEAQVQA
jgi:single-stranded-DNA-specific exonuclease